LSPTAQFPVDRFNLASIAEHPIKQHICWQQICCNFIALFINILQIICCENILERSVAIRYSPILIGIPEIAIIGKTNDSGDSICQDVPISEPTLTENPIDCRIYFAANAH
jgi:hypothetical protein